MSKNQNQYPIYIDMPMQSHQLNLNNMHQMLRKKLGYAKTRRLFRLAEKSNSRYVVPTTINPSKFMSNKISSSAANQFPARARRLKKKRDDWAKKPTPLVELYALRIYFRNESDLIQFKISR